MNKNNLLTMMALDEYENPKIPTLTEAKPEILKKIPSRWRNTAFIAAASLSILSAVPLSGCTGLHHGGAASAPLYIAYLTEQEAADIIRRYLEEAGLNLVEPLERYRINVSWIAGHRPTLILVDEEHNLNIVLNSNRSRRHDLETNRVQTTERVIEQFEEDFDISVNAVFFSSHDEIYSRNIEQQTEQFRREFIEDLENQIQAFIEQLREKGIIE